MEIEEDIGPISDKIIRYPDRIAVIFTAITTYIFYLFVPYGQYQLHIWLFACVAFVIGDSITTGLLGMHDLPEGQPLTLWICGIHPTFRCAFASRVGIFIAVFLIYLSSTHLISSFPFIKSTVYLFPVVLSAMGIIAAFLNIYAVILVRRDILTIPAGEETE